MTNLDLDVPSMISIEYPLRVKNVDRAIDMIEGGKEKIGKCFIDQEMKLELKLRNDPMSHPLRSQMVKGENVLVKIKLPKGYAKNGLREGIEKCNLEGKRWSVEPVGVLKQNYKFRELADFQKIDRGEYTKKFNSLRNGDYEGIKEFSKEIGSRLNNIQGFTKGEDLDISGLIRYARADIPYNYKYYGNLLLDDQGRWLSKGIKLYTIQVDWEDETPTTYDPKLDAEKKKAEEDIKQMKEAEMSEKVIKDSVSTHLLECIEILKTLFDMKPVWIRKQIKWLIPERLRMQLRFALPFVSYTFKKGPWRHSNVRLGYDPREDREAYKSQIEAFRGTNGSKTQKVKIDEVFIIPPSLHAYIDEFSNPESEIRKLGIGKLPRQLFFDGKNVSDSLSFQIGDILDEDVKKVLENMKFVDCNIETGWIDFVTLDRVKSVIKYKLMCVREGVGINEDKVRELMTRSRERGVKNDEDDEEEEDEGEGEEEEEEEEEERKEEEEEENNGDGDDDANNKDYEGVEKLKTIQHDENGDYGMKDVNVEAGAEADDVNDEDGVSEEEEMDLLTRLKRFNPRGNDIIAELGDIIKQEQVM